MIDFDKWYEKEGYGLAFGSGKSSDCYFGAKEAWDYQQAKIDELQIRLAVYDKHVKAIKHIHETQFDKNTDTSFILGNLDGFIEYLESDLKGNKDEN